MVTEAFRWTKGRFKVFVVVAFQVFVREEPFELFNLISVIVGV